MGEVVRRALRVPALLVVLVVLLAGCLEVRPVDPEALGGLDRTSRVVAADGTVLAELHGEQDRTPLPLEAVPPVLVDAVLAAEDRRFFSHDGVDERAVARALLADVRAGTVEQGGSTITQQLVKNTLVDPDRTVARKVREASLALGLERGATKQEILERYLDTVYLGRGAYGTAAGMRLWFGVEADPAGPPPALAPEQAALLAALIRSPGTTDPVEHPGTARSRRDGVLDAMVTTGALSPDEAARAAAAALPTAPARPGAARHAAPWAVERAVRALLDDERLGATRAERERRLFRGGLTVRLTVEPDHQRAAEQALADVLVEPADPDGAVVSLRPGDGALTAVVGGRDFYGDSPSARVDLAAGGSTGRQAGSVMKVFALLAAVEAGMSPSDELSAPARVVVARRYGDDWEVENYAGAAPGTVTLREAVEQSVNTAFVDLLARLGDGDVDDGAAAVVAVASRLGVTARDGGPLPAVPSVVLGSVETDPVSLTAAVAALGAGGVWARPRLVAEVVDADGEVLLADGPVTEQAVSPGAAAVAVDVLAGVVTRGTGVRARSPLPTAAKTGTTDDHADAWFVGTTPSLATGVWVGRAEGRVPMRPEDGTRTVVAGGTWPAEVWRRAVTASLAGTPAGAFPVPAEAVVDVRVDAVRGCLPTAFTPQAHVSTERFLAGEQPTERCARPSRPAATSVPDVAGTTADAAAEVALDDVGFVVRRVEVPAAGLAPGAAVGTEPAAGSAVPAGAVVVVREAATGGVDVVVPDVLGLDEQQARARLAEVGLVVRVTVEPSCGGGRAEVPGGARRAPGCERALARDAGRVWRSDVPAGTTVRSSRAGPAGRRPGLSPPRTRRSTQGRSPR